MLTRRKHLRKSGALLSPTYGTRFFTKNLEAYTMAEGGIPPASAYQIIHDELDLDGNPSLNLASFVTTWMEPEARQLINENLQKIWSTRTNTRKRASSSTGSSTCWPTSFTLRKNSTSPEPRRSDPRKPSFWDYSPTKNVGRMNAKRKVSPSTGPTWSLVEMSMWCGTSSPGILTWRCALSR